MLDVNGFVRRTCLGLCSGWCIAGAPIDADLGQLRKFRSNRRLDLALDALTNRGRKALITKHHDKSLPFSGYAQHGPLHEAAAQRIFDSFQRTGDDLFELLPAIRHEDSLS